MGSGASFKVFLAIIFGCVAGVGAYTFIYAKGYSYFTHDAAACANCHVMEDHYDAWLKSSHRNAAACNDCHTPPGVIPRYLTKASNGFWHSFAFTTGLFPDPIRIKQRNIEVTEKACRNCHQDIFIAIEGTVPAKGTPVSCIKCHQSVGHLE